MSNGESIEDLMDDCKNGIIECAKELNMSSYDIVNSFDKILDNSNFSQDFKDFIQVKIRKDFAVGLN